MSLPAVNLNGGISNLGSGSNVDPVSSIGLSRSQGGIEVDGAGQPLDPIKDDVTISDEAQALYDGQEAGKAKGPDAETLATENEEKDDEVDDGELTAEEQDLVDRLKERDLEVRAHEQAHLRAAGSYAKGGPQFDYQTGPDGKRYAVGGHVDIDVGKERDPEATIAKAEQIKRAALAPAEPSSKDRQVAAQADRMKAEAQTELQQEALESEGVAERSETTETEETSDVESPEVEGFEDETDDDSPEVAPLESLPRVDDTGQNLFQREEPTTTEASFQPGNVFQEQQKSTPRVGSFDGLNGTGQGEDAPQAGTFGTFANPYDNQGTAGLIGQGVSLIA